MPGVGLTPGGAVVAEDVRDLQRWPRHAGAKRPLYASGARRFFFSIRR